MQLDMTLRDLVKEHGLADTIRSLTKVCDEFAAECRKEKMLNTTYALQKMSVRFSELAKRADTLGL